jgi:hypothetical protein
MSCPVLVKYEQQLLSSSCGEAKSSTDHGNNQCIKINIINFQLTFIHIFNTGSIPATLFEYTKLKNFIFPSFIRFTSLHFTTSLDQDFLSFRPLFPIFSLLSVLFLLGPLKFSYPSFFHLLSLTCIISPSPFKVFPPLLSLHPGSPTPPQPTAHLDRSTVLPRANTGMRHRPPRMTMSETVLVNRFSLSSLFSWMWVPYVDSTINTSGLQEAFRFHTRRIKTNNPFSFIFWIFTPPFSGMLAI